MVAALSASFRTTTGGDGCADLVGGAGGRAQELTGGGAGARIGGRTIPAVDGGRARSLATDGGCGEFHQSIGRAGARTGPNTIPSVDGGCGELGVSGSTKVMAGPCGHFPSSVIDDQ